MSHCLAFMKRKTKVLYLKCFEGKGKNDYSMQWFLKVLKLLFFLKKAKNYCNQNDISDINPPPPKKKTILEKKIISDMKNICWFGVQLSPDANYVFFSGV